MTVTNGCKPVLILAILSFSLLLLDTVYAQNVTNMTSQEIRRLVEAGSLRITHVVERPSEGVCYIREIYYENLTRVKELEEEVYELKLTIRRLKGEIEKLNVTPPWVLPTECNVTIHRTILNVTNVTVYEITNLTYPEVNLSCPEPIVNVSCPQPNITLECPEPNITLQCPEIEFPWVFTQECEVTIINVTERTYNLTCPEPVVKCPELEVEELIKRVVENITEEMRILNLTCPEPVIELECPSPRINLTCPQPNVSLECPPCPNVTLECEYPNLTLPLVVPEECETIIVNKTEVLLTCPQPNISLECPSIECPPCPNVSVVCPQMINLTLPYIAPEEWRIVVQNVTVKNVTCVCDVSKQNVSVVWPRPKSPTALLVLVSKVKGGLLRVMNSLIKGIGELFMACVARTLWLVYLLFLIPIVVFLTLLWYRKRVRRTPEEF